MRLWSMHPKYLDRQGLTALWREGLGALVSLDPNRGYHNHPQLNRFKVRKLKGALADGQKLDSFKLLNTYLYYVYNEAKSRGYNYDFSKLTGPFSNIWPNSIAVTKGQIDFEMKHLHKKMKDRSIPQFSKSIKANQVLLNPIFYLIDGDIEDWEKL